jgi:hypothetical protein
MLGEVWQIIEKIDWLLGIIVGYLLTLSHERVKSAKLKLTKLYFEPFEQSARVSVCVRHVGGSLPAKNVVGFLTVEANTELKKIVVEKVWESCSLENIGCRLCGGKTYLALPKAGIESEPLAWSVPIYVGRGLEGLELTHVTHVPVGGEAKLRLFDIYRVKVYDHTIAGSRILKDEFWLIKVHSEYGVTYYPRICLKLSATNPTELILNIKLAGENVRRNVKGEVKIRLKGSEYVVEHDKEEYLLSKYFDSNNIKPLELPQLLFTMEAH